MKAGGLIERAFDIQTASYFTKLVMSALVLNMALALVEFPGAAASAPRGCTLAFAAYILAELLFLAVIAFDCALKAYYMNFKDYFKKNWQRSHATVIALLFADWALTLCSGGHAQRVHSRVGIRRIDRTEASRARARSIVSTGRYNHCIASA